MTDPLDEILEAAGIPIDHPTRILAKRDGHNVVGPAPDYGTIEFNGQKMPITSVKFTSIDDTGLPVGSLYNLAAVNTDRRPYMESFPIASPPRGEINFVAPPDDIFERNDDD